MIKHNGGGSLYQGPTYSRLVALVAIGVQQGQFAFKPSCNYICIWWSLTTGCYWRCEQYNAITLLLQWMQVAFCRNMACFVSGKALDDGSGQWWCWQPCHLAGGGWLSATFALLAWRYQGESTLGNNQNSVTREDWESEVWLELMTLYSAQVCGNIYNYTFYALNGVSIDPGMRLLMDLWWRNVSYPVEQPGRWVCSCFASTHLVKSRWKDRYCFVYVLISGVQYVW